MNENGAALLPRPEHPGEYLTDFQTRRAVELIDQAAPSANPFFLSLWYTAPHRGGRATRTIRSPGHPLPAPRHRDAFAGQSMPRPPNFNEANMYDKPQVVADRRRFSAERIAGIEENWRQSSRACSRWTRAWPR